MTLRNQLLAALAAATLAAPVAFSQEPPSPPSPQDQDSADVGEPAPQDQQELPPTQTDEQTAPGAATDEDERAPGAATTPGATNASAGPIEDKKLDQFADAYMAVQTIQQKAATELQTAKDPQQADKVKATAESDMIAAVERSGLQVPEFTRSSSAWRRIRKYAHASQRSCRNAAARRLARSRTTPAADR
jgi:hypothetical protein